MLEELAIRYISQTAENLRLIGYGLVVAGAVLAGVTWRGTLAISRAPYFAYTGAIFLATAVASVVWLNSLAAIAGGYVWVFMAMDVFVLIAAGYALCVIAMARSRDAFGHNAGATLAFIPLLNLVLLVARSKKGRDINRVPTPPLVTGGIGVLFGVVALAAAIVLQAFVTIESQKIVEDAGQSEEALAAGNTMAVRQFGVEAVVQQLAAEIQEPMQVDEITTLVRAEADGRTFRYVYRVDTDQKGLSDEFTQGLRVHFCTYKPFIPVIQEGGTIAAVYFNVNSEIMGEVYSSAAVCGF